MGTTLASRRLIDRKEIVIAIGSISFIVGLLNYFWRAQLGPIATASDYISNWIVTVQNFGLMLGAIMVIRLGIRNTMRQTPGTWYFEAAKVVIVVATLGVAIWDGLSGPTWLALIGDYYSPTGAAAKAIQGFYGITASYRAWRGRSLKTLIAMALMFFVLFTSSPLGPAVHPTMQTILDWLFDVVQGAAFRALTMAMAFGGIYLGIRLVLGRELRVFGREDAVEAE